MKELQKRLKTDNIFEFVFSKEIIDMTKRGDYPLPRTDADFKCYSNLIDFYNVTCGQPDTYIMKYFGAFL